MRYEQGEGEERGWQEGSETCRIKPFLYTDKM